MNKKKKKGFTLVELLVVIAILAVLATVSILGYSAFVKKANMANDRAVVEQMNKALMANEALSNAARYCDEAVDQAIEAGFILENLTPSTSGFHFAYDQKYNRFMLLTESHSYEYGDNNHTDVEVEPWNIFVVVGSQEEIDKAIKEVDGITRSFSIYTRVEFEFAKDSNNTITVGAGFDAGKCLDVKKVIYNNQTEKAQEVLMHTNTFGTSMIVEGPLDTVTHYGFAGIVVVKKVAMASFDEYGVVGREVIEEGHLDIKEDATVYQVQQAGVVNSETKTKVSVSFDAIVYDVHHEKIEGAVENESVKFSSSTDTKTIASIGSNVGDTITATACKHENSEDVVDSVHVYEVCKTCGYTLIKVNGNKMTVAVSSAAGSENVIIPKASYDSSQVTKGGTNGEAIINKNTDGSYVTPSIEETPVVNNGNITKNCSHKWQYVYLGTGMHKVICSKCQVSYSETCDFDGNDYSCSKCGKTNYDVEISKVGTTNTFMTLGQFRDSVNNGNSFAGYKVTLLHDVDLKCKEWVPIGKLNNEFKGIFDGNNHTIKNFKVNSSTGYAGLFGIVYGNKDYVFINTDYYSRFNSSNKSYDIANLGTNMTAQLMNLTIENGEINTAKDKKCSGILAGHISYALVENITIKNSTINADKGAGLVVGNMAGSVINNCSTDNNCYAEVSTYNVGGIVGTICNASDSKYNDIVNKNYVDAEAIINCTNYATVVTSAQGVAGGIIGAAQNGYTLLYGCSNYGNIKSTKIGDKKRGISGICGQAATGGDNDLANNNKYNQFVFNCSNYGEIEGYTNCAAGIITYCFGYIKNCVNEGIIRGDVYKMSGIASRIDSLSKFIDCGNSGQFSLENMHVSPNEINDSVSKITITGTFNTTSELNTYLNEAATTNMELNCNVLSVSGGLTIPNKVENISSTNIVCENIVFENDREKAVTINIPSITYTYTSNLPYDCTFKGANNVININQGVTYEKALTLGGKGITFNNNGTTGEITIKDNTIVNNLEKGIISRLVYNAASTSVINNYGTIGNNNKLHTIYAYAKVDLTIHNYSILNSPTEQYQRALFFKEKSNAYYKFYAYKDSKIVKIGNGGIHAQTANNKIDFIVQKGADGLNESENSYYTLKNNTNGGYVRTVTIVD